MLEQGVPKVNSAVPGFSADWYRDVTDFAASTPAWLQAAASFATQAILLVFFAMIVLAWWRARRASGRAMALALLAPVVTVVAYLISEVIKSVVHEERPCRAVARIMTPVSSCPDPGDWSFPSNHSVLAAAAAVALVIAWRRLTLILPFVALLEAFTRVFVGAHYPHDVLVGLLLGAFVAALLVLATMGPLTRAVKILREHPLWRPILVASAPDRDPLTKTSA